ncbi:MAG: twin-arginine translocase subunit TatB [Xanthomonadaceae bacterium]|nr:twin-arginine translocase subunit TatB [Xanthomonadaceae bacterium]
MFGIDFNELLLIAVVALVVLGPERLPGVARTAGTLVRRARNAWASVKAEVQDQIEMESLKSEIGNVTKDMRAAVTPLAEQARDAMEDLRTSGTAALREARDIVDPAGPARAEPATPVPSVEQKSAAPGKPATADAEGLHEAQTALADSLRELAGAAERAGSAPASTSEELRLAASAVRAAARRLDEVISAAAGVVGES